MNESTTNPSNHLSNVGLYHPPANKALCPNHHLRSGNRVKNGRARISLITKILSYLKARFATCHTQTNRVVHNQRHVGRRTQPPLFLSPSTKQKLADLLKRTSPAPPSSLTRTLLALQTMEAVTPCDAQMTPNESKLIGPNQSNEK